MPTTLPLKDLLLKWKEKLPDLLEEMNNFLYAQEEKIETLEEELSRVGEDLEDAEEELSQTRSKELTLDAVEEWVLNAGERDQEKILDLLDLPLIKVPASLDSMQGIYIHKLEEYFRSNSAEDTYLKLTQDHSREVEELRERVKDLQASLEGLEGDNDSLKDQLEDATYYARKNN